MTQIVAQLAGVDGSGHRNTWLVLLLCLGGAPLLAYLALSGQVRVSIALVIGGGLLALATLRIQSAIFATVAYLVLMGDLRKMLIPWAGWSGTDPLILLGPVVAATLCAYAFASRSVRLDTSMARWILVLMGIMVLQVFNPQQGGLLVGAAGALFYFVPLLWFWIGRTYATPAFMKTLLFGGVIPLAVLAALMGYYQTFVGYLPYQQQWFDIAAYNALGSEGIQSAVAFFQSSTEYGNFLIIAIMLLWARVLKEKQWVMLVLIAFLFVAVFLTGSRGPVVKLLLVGAALWAILGRARSTWVARGAVAVLIGVLGLVWGLGQVGEVGGNDRVQHRVGRQADGLLNPTGENSTMVNHSHGLLRGYKMALRNPVGRGLGSTTKAAHKFGGNATGTEVDSSNMFVSTGILGGMAYLVIIFLVIRSLIRYWSRTRSLVAMSLVGVLGVIFLMWFSGYTVATLVWFCIGALDRFENQRADSAGAPST